MSLIPISRVFINYEPTTSSVEKSDFGSVIIGKSRDLHDLTSQGWFNPKDEDTNLDYTLKGVLPTQNIITTVAAYNAATTYSLSFSFSSGALATTVSSTGALTEEDMLNDLANKINALKNIYILAEANESELVVYTTSYASDTAEEVTIASILNLAAPVVVVPSDLEVSHTNYPSYKSGSLIDTKTIKISVADASAIVERVTNVSTGIGAEVLFPVASNKAVVGRVSSTDGKTLSLSIGSADTSVNWVDSILASSNKFILPGSIVVNITNTTTSAVNRFRDIDSMVVDLLDPTKDAVTPAKEIDGTISFINDSSNSIAQFATGTIVVDYVTGKITSSINISGNASDNITVQVSYLTIEQVLSSDMATHWKNFIKVGDSIAVASSVSLENRIFSSLVNASNTETILATDVSDIRDRITDNSRIYAEDPTTGVIKTYTWDGSIYRFVNGSDYFSISTSGSSAPYVLRCNKAHAPAGITDYIIDLALKLSPSEKLTTIPNASNNITWASTSLVKYINDVNFLNSDISKFKMLFSAVNRPKKLTIKSIASMSVSGKSIPEVISFYGLLSSSAATINYSSTCNYTVITNNNTFQLLDTTNFLPTSADPIQVETAAGNEGDLTFKVNPGSHRYALSVTLGTSSIPRDLLAGNVYIEYEADISSVAVINNLFEINPSTISSTEIIEALGPVDPRNELMFAAQLLLNASGAVSFYVMPMSTDTNGLSEALTFLSAKPEILHVAVLTDDYSHTLDSWVSEENLPDNSRFRSVYCSKKVEELVTKLNNEDSTLVPSGHLHKMNGSSIYYSTTEVINFKDYNLAPGDIFTTGAEEYLISEVFEDTLTFEQIASSTETTLITSFIVTRELTVHEQADWLADTQSSTTQMTVVLHSGTMYEYEDITGTTRTMLLDPKYGIVYPLSIELSMPSHQPHTFVEHSGIGFKTVIKSEGYFNLDDFKKLISAGYYVLTTDTGSAPFCLKDTLLSFKASKANLDGTISSVVPVWYYAKDIYKVTKNFLGKYHTTGDTQRAISISLNALRESYMANTYQYLGTIFKSMSIPAIKKEGNGFRIDYIVTPQTATDEINNYILVTEDK